MAITDVFKNLFKEKQLSNSLGVVARNYGKKPSFEPTRQLTGITYKAVDKIGQTLSVYEPIVSRPNGDAYTSHPLLALYNSPNPVIRNASDFIHLYGMETVIYGETFWYLARGESTRRIKEIYLLNPSQMELKISDGELIGYVLHKNNGQQIPFTQEEIYHDKTPNPFNEWRGMSVLERAAAYIDTEINTTHFTLNYIRNSGSPSGIVGLPATMSREDFKLFAAQWREGYEGPENAGKTAFVRGGETTFKAVGSTLKDIDQKVTRQMAKEDVLMMLDVPKPLLGMTDDTGFGRGNVETLKLIFAESVLEPMMRRLDRIYEYIGMQMNNGQPIDIDHESPVPEDREFNLQTYEKGVNVWMTVNEVREREGLLPLPGGDDLIKNTPVEPQKKLKIIAKKKLTKSEQIKKISEEQEDFRKNLIDTNEIYEKKIKREISDFVKKQEFEVISKINATKKNFEQWMFNIKEESEALAALLIPIMIELMEAQSEDVANFITGELLTITPEIRTAVETNIKQLSGVFNQDTITALEKTLSEGQTAGESLAKLKKRVESTYSDVKGYRAERIARTESLKASNNTAELVYKQNGYTQVEWFINPGACEFCRTFAGRTKAVGANFITIGDVITGEGGSQMKIEYDNIPYPPLHPNCTCSLIPVT